jgi:hypothetical protein
MSDGNKKPDGASASSASMAGGVFIALGIMIGTLFGGIAFGQPSIGFIVGLIGGSIAAVAVALGDKPKA